MRKPLIAGNWKMNGSLSQVNLLVEGIKRGAGQYADIDILVLPPFLYLTTIRDLLVDTPIALGAQNLYLGKEGAFTGEISGTMLADVGCKYVLVGHSERRTIFNEDNELLAAKFKAAIDANLTPILCVGETREEREHGRTMTIIQQQLEPVIKVAGIAAFARAVIAYEPVWAIGTGLTATPEQAQEVHAHIRKIIMQNNVDIAKTIRILYGGSMKPDNATALLSQADIDGGLIGGASLDANSFLQICAAASSEKTAVKAHKTAS